MFTRQKRDAEIQSQFQTFAFATSVEEKGVQLIAVLDERQGKRNVSAEEFARNQRFFIS